MAVGSDMGADAAAGSHAATGSHAGEGAPLAPPEFRHCPACGAALTRDRETRRPTCPRCGFVQHLNPIAVVAAVLLSSTGGLPPAGGWVSPAQATHILLVRRAGTFAGQWCIPCGYVEYGEEIRAAAAREMLEETGLVTEVLDPLAVLSNFHRPAEQSVGVWFHVRLLEGRLKAGDDADRVAFFSLQERTIPLAFPTDRQVIETIRAAG